MLTVTNVLFVKVLMLACLLAYCAGNPFSVTQRPYVDIDRVHMEARIVGSQNVGQWQGERARTYVGDRTI